MSDDLNSLHQLVARLGRRERSLWIREAALRGLTLGAVGLLGASWAAWRDVQVGTAVAFLTLLLGAGLWFGVVAPLRAHVRQALDAQRQARRVEALRPALRGRLLTVVGRPAGAVGAESPAILDLVARRAQASLVGLTEDQVHPADGVRRWARVALSAWLVVLVAWMVGPMGAPGVAQWWLGDTVAGATIASSSVEGAGVAARVGDVTLRYVYPDYTGLEPYEVVNSTGEAHAPPGTRVEVVARSAEPVQGASMVAYDQPPLSAVVTDGRTIAASFVVRAESGTYQLHTQVDGEVRVSRAFPIFSEADLPPEVTLDASSDVIEVPVDAFLDLPWMARDDYGVSRVQVSVDGEVRPGALRVPRGRTPEVRDILHTRPQDLGMVPGATYRLSIVAEDNDTVSGAKLGESNVVEIVVLGTDGVARMDHGKRLELLDLLVDALGDHLEEVYPPGRRSGDYARWGAVVGARYEPLSAFVEAHRSRRTKGPEWRPVEEALEDGRRLIRYTQVSFQPGASERANDASVAAVADLRTLCIDSLEVAVLHIDGLLRNEAIARLMEDATASANEAASLRAALDAGDMDAGEIAMAAGTVRELVDGLAGAARDLPEGGLRDFVLSRTGEANSLIDEVRGELDAGDVAGGTAMMSRLAERLDELAAGIRDEMERRMENAEQQGKEADDLEKLLKELAARQDVLAERVQQVRELGSEGYRQTIRDLWAEAEARAGDVVAALDTMVEGLTAARRIDDLGADMAFNEQTFVETAQEDASTVLDAAVVRDLAGLSLMTLDLQRHWAGYTYRYEGFVQMRGVPKGPGLREIQAVQGHIVRLQDVIEQLRRQDELGDPGMRSQIRQVESEQRTLTSDLADARQDAKRLAQEMPVTPRGMLEALEQADVRMQQAGDALGRGDGMQGQGSQQAAAQHIRDALEALDQAKAQGAQQAAEMSSGGAGGKEEGDEEAPGNERGEGDPGEVKLELPSPEDFTTPEAYREALLRGMEGDVPEEYRALKRRYYEELVHQ